MRVCLVGLNDYVLDEGMKNVFYHLSNGLKKHFDVLSLNINEVYTRSFWKQLFQFKPNVIHYVPGPSVKSFALVKVLSLLLPGTKTIMFALHPMLSGIPKNLIRLLKPNLILCQSEWLVRFFSSSGCNVQFIPLGVDLNKFKPVSLDKKVALRKKYGLDTTKYLILHVGSIKEGRGLKVFQKVQGSCNQVIIVGSPSVGFESSLLKKLDTAGCIVIREYIDNIEEIYQMVDCYIFPVNPAEIINGLKNAHSIEFPLSVVEAMAVNIPVITKRFGALPKLFSEGDGLLYIDSDEDVIAALESIKSTEKYATRIKVMPLSWEGLCEKLRDIYIKEL